MGRKVWTGIILCSLVAGLAQAAEIRYKSSGDWSATTNSTGDAYGWRTTGALPGDGDLGIINWGSNTVTGTASHSIGTLRVGQDEKGVLVIASGGTLTTVAGSGQNGRLTRGQGEGGAGTGYMLVQSGGIVNVAEILYNGNKANGTADIYGQVNVASHLWTGWNNGITGTYNIYDGGELNVSQMLGLNWQNNGAIGLLNVYDGGVVNLSQLRADGVSVQGSSLVTIAGSGVIYLANGGGSGWVNIVQEQYIDTGKIVGEGGATVVPTWDAENDRVVIAIPEPATLGLMGIFGIGAFVIRRFYRS